MQKCQKLPRLDFPTSDADFRPFINRDIRLISKKSVTYSCVHNQIATFGLFSRQLVTLNIGLHIGCSHNRDNRISEQSAKCTIGQTLVQITSSWATLFPSFKNSNLDPHACQNNLSIFHLSFLSKPLRDTSLFSSCPILKSAFDPV